MVDVTLGGGCEGYVAVEGGEEAVAVAERGVLGHIHDLLL